VAFKLAYSTLRWKNPDLEIALEELKRAGWDGWEGRLSLEWLGTPARLKRICDNIGMPMLVYTADASPDTRDPIAFERNKRRMEFAAEIGADCFMFMNAPKECTYAPSADEIVAAAEGADEWAEYAAQLGLELSYHIHTNMLVDSIHDWKLYMSRLKTAKLCIDVSHAQLWGYEPNQSIREFQSQLNYIHLQDWVSTARREDGFYLPVWCDVGEYENVDFPAIKKTLTEIGYQRIVTACPGEPPENDDPVSAAIRSKGMVDYLRTIGY